jgi:hypothetical protein
MQLRRAGRSDQMTVRNLPDEVEPDVTYRDVRVSWRAAAKIRPNEERKPGER